MQRNELILYRNGISYFVHGDAQTRKVLWIPLKNLQSVLGIRHTILFLFNCDHSLHLTYEQFFHVQMLIQIYSFTREAGTLLSPIRELSILLVISRYLHQQGVQNVHRHLFSYNHYENFKLPINSSNRISRFANMFIKLLLSLPFLKIKFMNKRFSSIFWKSLDLYESNKR